MWIRYHLVDILSPRVSGIILTYILYSSHLTVQCFGTHCIPIGASNLVRRWSKLIGSGEQIRKGLADLQLALITVWKENEPKGIAVGDVTMKLLASAGAYDMTETSSPLRPGPTSCQFIAYHYQPDQNHPV